MCSKVCLSMIGRATRDSVIISLAYGLSLLGSVAYSFASSAGSIAAASFANLEASFLYSAGS